MASVHLYYALKTFAKLQMHFNPDQNCLDGHLSFYRHAPTLLHPANHHRSWGRSFMGTGVG